MLAETVDAVIGIDTHRDSHEVEIADPAGKPVMTMRIGNDSAGFARLLAAIAEVVRGPRVAVAAGPGARRSYSSMAPPMRRRWRRKVYDGSVARRAR
jgi:hypothetical protein